jgi:hypothetical protein
MKTLAEKYAADIKIGFDQAGSGNIYLAFLDQLKVGTFTDKAIPAGEKFYWMLFRVKGKVRVWEDVEWAGKKPLEVFSLTVAKDEKNYEFVIPKPCGNIALYKISEAKKVVPPAICDVVVTPAKVNINELVTVDMSRTKNAAAMNVDVLTAQGTKISSHAFTPASPRWQTKFDKPGEYVFSAKATNAEGKLSENPCQAKVYVNSPPVCKLWTSCLPCKDYVGKPITFDASGSSDPDGQVAKVSFEITDEAGTVVDSTVDTEKPFVWEKVFKKPGKYGVHVVVFDDMGAVSSGDDPCRLTLEVTQKRFFYLAEAGGLLAHGTYTGYVFGRLGLMWNLVPDVADFVLRAGGGVPSRSDPWKAVLVGDILMNFHLGQWVYIGGGFGYGSKEQDARKNGMDFVGDFGVNVFNKYTSAGSIFGEIRMPIITKERNFEDHHKLLLGFRCIF